MQECEGCLPRGGDLLCGLTNRSHRANHLLTATMSTSHKSFLEGKAQRVHFARKLSFRDTVSGHTARKWQSYQIRGQSQPSPKAHF